jgi:hypothetical protein
MLPTIVAHDLVRCFSYWQEEIQQGMFYRGELYTLVKRFSADERLQAYQASMDLDEQGKALCMTVDASGYYLWKTLRLQSSQSSDAEPAFQPENILVTANKVYQQEH